MLEALHALLPSATALSLVVAGLALVATCGFFFMIPRMITQAKPNEWLVVIRGGEQREAGIGLKTFVWPMENWVTFPSVLTKVSFDAMQTTKEMQGVHVFGFAIFSVLRTGDGPFRYYKYVQGAGAHAAQDSLKGMAEALLRKHVATIGLEQVLQDRQKLRDAVRTEMMETTKGWGVWLETFEIKEVKVCSRALFEDLQAEFRNDTHVHAEAARLAAAKTMAEQSAKHEEEIALLNKRTNLAKAKARVDTQTEQVRFEGEADVERARTALTVQEQQLELEKQKLEAELQLEQARQAQEHELKWQELTLQQSRLNAVHKEELTRRREQQEADAEMSDKAMKKYMIESTADIYKHLPLRDVKLHNFVSPDGASSGGLAALLPGVGALASTVQNADA